jgi:hypothetical protein
MTRREVQDWLDRYVAAWKSYDRGEIAALFSEDAEYRYHPWDDPVSGREAIVQDWITPIGDASRRDAEGTYDAHYEAWAVDGTRAVAVGTSTYWADATRSKVTRFYDNVFLLEFDAAGLCTSFTEHFMDRPKARRPG